MPQVPHPHERRLSLPWRALEAGFRRAFRIEPLEGRADALLAYNRTRYRGPDLVLSCGAVIRAGDPVLELHFRREALLPLMRDPEPARMWLGLVRLGDRDIPRLAALLERDPALRDIRAAHALTLFHRGIRRYGFEVLPLGPGEGWFTVWFRVLMARDHPEGWRHVRANRARLTARSVWISREELIRRHARELPPSPPRPAIHG